MLGRIICLQIFEKVSEYYFAITFHTSKTVTFSLDQVLPEKRRAWKYFCRRCSRKTHFRAVIVLSLTGDRFCPWPL